MTSTWPGALAWAKAHPLNPHGQDWDGYCEMLVADAGGYTNSFSTATLDLAHASKLYTPSQLDIARVPAGWLLHWAFIGSDGVNYGHVAFSDGAGYALMASSYVTSRVNSSRHLGTIRSATYQGVSGHKYLGASPDHGGQYLQGIPHTLIVKTAPTYTVVKGDTLVKIAKAHGTGWKKLYALNIGVIGKDPDAIKVGMKLRLP